MLLPSRNREPGGLEKTLRTALMAYRRLTNPPPRRRPARERPLPRTGEHDVVLDVPNLEVEELDLELDQLKARVALEARVLDLLRLDVGVDAELGSVSLKLSGVEAEAHLKVRLDNLAEIVDRVLETVDRNPQIIEGVARGAQGAVADVTNAVGDVVDRQAKVRSRERRDRRPVPARRNSGRHQVRARSANP